MSWVLLEQNNMAYWFIKNKKEKIAYCVNTKNVVTGFNKERNEFSKTFCETVKNEIKSKI